MQRIVVGFSAALCCLAILSPALAQQPAPAAAAAPELKKDETKGAEGQDVKRVKKRAAPSSTPKAAEPSEVKRAKKKRKPAASPGSTTGEGPAAGKQEPKGAEGPGNQKE